MVFFSIFRIAGKNVNLPHKHIVKQSCKYCDALKQHLKGIKKSYANMKNTVIEM